MDRVPSLKKTEIEHEKKGSNLIFYFIQFCKTFNILYNPYIRFTSYFYSETQTYSLSSLALNDSGPRIHEG